jgi:hypothetical protein
VWRSFRQGRGRRLGVVRLWNTPWQASQFTHVFSRVIAGAGAGGVYSKWCVPVSGKYDVVRRIVSCNATPIPKKARLRSSKGSACADRRRSYRMCRKRSGHVSDLRFEGVSVSPAVMNTCSLETRWNVLASAMPDLRLISDQGVKEWVTSFAAAIFTALGKFYAKRCSFTRHRGALYNSPPRRHSSVGRATAL